MSTTHPHTALLLIDPYNDFLHPDGKMYSALQSSLEDSKTIQHIRELLPAVRAHKIPVYYCLHQQYKPSFYSGWKHMTASHTLQAGGKVFEEGSWGAAILEGMEPDVANGDVLVGRHWNSSSFNNTDLDFQLRQREITHVVIAGLTANACVEATARYAYDMGYHVTLISDATAGFTIEQKAVATEIIWPLFANEVVTTEEFVKGL